MLNLWWKFQPFVIRGGTLRNRTIWLDFLKLEDVDVRDCKLVYFGCGGVSILGQTTITNCKIMIMRENNACRELYAALTSRRST